MAKILLLATTVVLLVSFATAVPHHRKKTSGFRLVPDSQFSCPEKSPPIGQKPLHRYELQPADLIKILESYGGTYMKNFMAYSREEARKHFPNSIDIPKKYKDMIYKANPDINKNGILLQQDVLNFIKSIRKADSNSHRVKAETPEQRNKPTSGVEDDQEKHRVEREVPEESKGFLKTERQLQSSHDNHLKLHEFLTKKSENEKTKRKTRSETTKDFGFPLVLPEDIGLKTPNTKNINISYCYLRGEGRYGNDEVVHMCTVCNAVRTMPPGIWPSSVYTSICDPNDAFCLDPEFTVASVCGENEFPLTMLCAVPNTCALAEVNGDTVVIDHYELCTQYISVACECFVHKDSIFYDFVSPV